MLLFPVDVKPHNAQTTSNYFVTVNPTTPDSPMYTTVGRNWTVSFEALWSYGENSGVAIKNAVVTVQVNNSKNDIVNTLQLNTTTGLFSFNYSLSTADILTFTPTKLISQEGAAYNSELLDVENSVCGFQSKSVVVWWDTFHVSLVNSNTDTLGAVDVSVNVTYLLLPEEGLTLPEWATYSNQKFFPKIVHGANITINGVEAKETSLGIYTANSSIWLPTAHILVEVSQEGWITAYTAFGVAHNSNAPIWTYALIFSLVFVIGALAIFFIYFGKRNDKVSLWKNYYPVLSGVMLAVACFISLYWGLVGLEGSLHEFGWGYLGIFGFLSFGFGLIGSIMSLRRKNQVLAILAVVATMITNSVIITTALDMYELANPWVMLIASFVLTIISGVLICNADEVFT